MRPDYALLQHRALVRFLSAKYRDTWNRGCTATWLYRLSTYALASLDRVSVLLYATMADNACDERVKVRPAVSWSVQPSASIALRPVARCSPDCFLCWAYFASVHLSVTICMPTRVSKSPLLAAHVVLVSSPIRSWATCPIAGCRKGPTRPRSLAGEPAKADQDMTHTDLVRPSRDGDQFHYLWAARLCLRMLPPRAELAAVSIEGVAPDEGTEIQAGLDVIDVAEYYGSSDPATATLIRYLQLKHSTRRTDAPWTISGLEPTLRRFAERYKKLSDRFGDEDVARRFTFEFVTNRPMHEAVIAALNDFTSGGPGAEDTALAKATGLTGSNLAGFTSQLRLTDRTAGYLAQRDLLESDISAYLPDNDKDAPLQLKDLVTRKATSEFRHDPVITRYDVLKAIGASDFDLYPAALLIEVPGLLVEREQIGGLVNQIVAQPGNVVIQADGGVGKSIVAICIGGRLPAGSETFVYDCFGNGSYRSASGYRHRPRDGLVQLANEMAGRSLCDPLIPTTKAEAKAYVRAFRSRVEQASAMLRERSSQALLCLVIDAADNAETAAQEAYDGASFPRLLLREGMPDNVRLVLTTRTHRVSLLDPPPNTRRLDLRPFSEQETAANLRAVFPDASAQDVGEFHRLTSSNPRVQATAIATAPTLGKVLAGLGPEPLTVQDTIARLLEAAFARVRDETPKVEQAHLDQVCVALATLRPFVPLDIVARTAGVSVALVSSIANDLQRPLLVRDGAIQFRDEPTETWFRERFRPSANDLDPFISRLMPLAGSSAYVAAVLPQLMLEAGRFGELVRLALEGGALPEGDAMARRDIELQRLQFALQAALRDKRYEAAAMLALKAGGERAAGERQQQLMGRNTDLAAHFLDAGQMLEQVSRRQVGGGTWTGSEHAYEAAFLSGNHALAGDARSRLRIAYDWLSHWIRSSRHDKRQSERMQVADIAELAWAELNLHGPGQGALQLRRWQPREISFSAGRIVTARLIDDARFDEVDALALAAGNDIGLLLAVLLELAAVGRKPPPAAIRRATRLASSRHIRIAAPGDWRGDATLQAAVTSLVVAAVQIRAAPRRKLAGLLKRYTPDHAPRSLAGQQANLGGARTAYLRAYALRKALMNQPLLLAGLAHPELRRKLADKHEHDPDVRRLREDVGALLPWNRLWADNALGRVRPADFGQRVAECAKDERTSYRERSATADEVTLIWGEMILSIVPMAATMEHWNTLDAWRASQRHPIATGTLIDLARRAARTGGQQDVALTLAKQAFDLTANHREDAESKADTYVLLARAVLPASLPEAKEYFEQAIIVSGRIGTENLSRWQAMLQLAEAGGRDGRDDPEIAYRFARAAELTYSFVARDKHFDWKHTVEALAGLSQRSALAILSRWLDRRFGREERLLSTACQYLVACKALDARTALALFPMQGKWEPDDLLEAALTAEADAGRRRDMAHHLATYIRFSDVSEKRLRRIDALLADFGIELPEMNAALLHAKVREADRAGRGEQGWVPPAKQSTRDWATLFGGLSLTRSQDLITAVQRFKEGEPSYRHEEFYKEAMARVSPGAEAAFLDALRQAQQLQLGDVRSLFLVLPKKWRERMAVRPAMARLLRQVCRQDCESLVHDRYYQALPWALASEVSGLSMPELIREAVEAMADTSVPADANGLFRLAGLLSHLITGNEAMSSLRYGLDLFEPLLEEPDGDGPWSQGLQPPGMVDAAVAGYLWAALASPAAARRWEAAHAVRGLCRVRSDGVLRALIDYAGGAGASAFADKKLRLYDRHALLWLMIALARAAAESGPAVTPHVGFLRRYANRREPHVLVRGFAAQAIAALQQQGLVEGSETEVAELERINASLLPSRTAKHPCRGGRTGRGRPYDPSSFSFGIDTGPYWLAPLGTVFGLSQEEIEEEAEKVIRVDWGLDDNGHWDRDERATRRYFEHSHVRHSQGSPPKVDDLGFYLSYHAMMVVAGKLLETKALFDDPEDSWDSFAAWLARHGLTRPDGLWLADRRDPTPGDLLTLSAVDEAEWPRSVTVDGTVPLLTPEPDTISVSGYWTQYAGDRKQTVSVSSALVCQDRAEALVRALRTTRDPSDYKVPDFEDRLEIDEGGYAFKGWIQPGDCSSRLDEYDPWAADMSAQVLAPASPFVRLLKLRADQGERTWHDGVSRSQLHSQVWSEGADDGEHSRNGGGQRLVASRGFVDALMLATGFHLVVRVSMERTLVQRHYHRGRENKHSEKITEVFLLRPGETPWRVRRGPEPWRGARRRTQT